MKTQSVLYLMILYIKKGGEKILKKYLVTFGLLGTLTFLGLFVYFYKTSGKFRQSIIAAFAAAIFFFSGLTPARGAGEADAFTPQPQHQSRPSHRSGFFSGRSNNDGSGPGKPNGDDSDGNDGGIPKYPKTESIEETQIHLSNIDEQINKLEEVTDSDSEIEENQCQIKPPGKFEVDFDFELDENGNPTLIIPMKDGSIRRIEFDQTRDKWYHEDLFPNISAPDGFDNQAVRDLKHSDRLAYLRENIPDKNVIELQNEIGKSLSHPKIISVPGFLGKYKIEGTVDINMQSGLVSFTDGVTNKHRTIVKMSPERIQKLAKDGFHMFPEK
jgi:hypothetical protein